MKKALYKITNLVNGKVYIGQSIHPNKRWIEHCYKGKNALDNYPIHLAINKYGKNNFSFQILEWSEDYDQREHDLILQYNSLSPNGYNILDGTSRNPVMYEEEHPRNTLITPIINKIISLLLENKISDIEIARQYNTTTKIVSDINHGITHKREGLTYPLRVRKGRTGGISNEVRMQIINDLYTTNLSYSKIAEKYNISKGMVGHINHGRYNPIPDMKYPIRSK